VNGKTWTADDARPQAQALAISGDKIMAVGSNEEVHALATTADTAVIDLQGRLVVPGFQDSHLHFPGQSVNGVIASTQAMFANPDATVLKNFAVLLGPGRASHANSFKDFDYAGVVQAFGSDWGASRLLRCQRFIAQ
jgi:predicted amidohydrolase YtcJ